MNSPSPESSGKTESLSVADLNAIGFHFERNPLAGANASLAQSYFFLRAAQDGVPAIRLNIARMLLAEGNIWSVRLSNGEQDLQDAVMGKTVSDPDPNVYRRSTSVAPKDVLPTVQRFLREIIEQHTPSVHDGVYSPAAVAAYCEEMRAEIAERQKTIVDVPV